MITKKTPQESPQVENEQTQQSEPQFITIDNRKIPCEYISYIVTQPWEDGRGDSRIKVFHYTNSNKTDRTNISFNNLLKKLPSNFMLIHKNQLINLYQVFKTEGLNVYLNGVEKEFNVSENKIEEFYLRWENVKKNKFPSHA